MHKFAFCHPGKIGDLLYILPALQTICDRDAAVADIYTSEACRAVVDFLRYQRRVRDVIIPADYVIQNDGQGIQPWNMPVPEGYDAVYQLGYEHFPQGPLHHYAARTAGVWPVPDPSYQFPDKKFCDEEYVVVAHCAHRSSSELHDHYKYFIENCPLKVIQTGTKADRVNTDKAIDMTGIDFLDMAALVSKAKAYVGFYSSPLVIANGFPGLLKIITMWPGVGEQHGLHIPITIDLYPPTGQSMLDTLRSYL